MNILFLHQNFPGQFKHLAPTLATQGHRVKALALRKTPSQTWQGVEIITYQPERGSTPKIHPWLIDFETKLIRAEAVLRQMQALDADGFVPDVVIAHPGWGESLFVKDVWPHTKLGIYCEFYYHARGADTGFDPEFDHTSPSDVSRFHLKNLNNFLHFQTADAGISPTHWQASTFPDDFRRRISVIHDGIDTDTIAPNPNVGLLLNGQQQLTKQHEIITFVNRNIEPYRGCHIFFRALPTLLKNRPNVQVLIIGGDDVSYGARPENGKTWKSIFIEEVRGQISDADWARVHFIGYAPYPDFIRMLQLSTVHVYLTYPFVLSWSLLEAMSCGCAIVASDTPPLKEAITHDATGRLVDFFDVQGLAQAVCRLLDSGEDRRRLGANARAFARENYDLKTVCLPKQLAWLQQLAS